MHYALLVFALLMAGFTMPTSLVRVPAKTDNPKGFPFW